MTKIPDATSVSAGDQAGFTVSLTNTGTGNAYDVTASDPLPGGTVWSISPASAGWSISGHAFPTRRSSDLGGASTSVHVVTTTDKTECPNLHNAATFTTSKNTSLNSNPDKAANAG